LDKERVERYLYRATALARVEKGAFELSEDGAAFRTPARTVDQLSGRIVKVCIGPHVCRILPAELAMPDFNRRPA